MLTTSYLNDLDKTATPKEIARHMLTLGFSSPEIAERTGFTRNYISELISSNKDNWKPEGMTVKQLRNNFQAFVIWISLAIGIKTRDISSHLRISCDSIYAIKSYNKPDQIIDLGYSVSGHTTKEIKSTNGDIITPQHASIKPLDLTAIKTFAFHCKDTDCQVDITQLFNAFELDDRPRF